MSETPSTDSKAAVDPWGPLVELLCSVTAEVQIPNLTVQNVLKLSPGTILNTHWRTNRDLPLRVNGRLLAFAEFDSPGDRMGVRLTEFIWEQQR